MTGSADGALVLTPPPRGAPRPILSAATGFSTPRTKHALLDPDAAEARDDEIDIHPGRDIYVNNVEQNRHIALHHLRLWIRLRHLRVPAVQLPHLEVLKPIATRINERVGKGVHDRVVAEQLGSQVIPNVPASARCGEEARIELGAVPHVGGAGTVRVGRGSLCRQPR